MWTLSTMFYLEVKGWTKNSYKNSIKLADSILWSGEKEGDKEQNYIGDKPFEQQPLSLVWKNKNAAWLKNRGNLYKKRVHKHFFIIWDLLETKMSDMPDQRPTCLIGDPSDMLDQARRSLMDLQSGMLDASLRWVSNQTCGSPKGLQ